MTSHLHALARVRNEASERQHAIDIAPPSDSLPCFRDQASAYWSDQIDATNAVILREPAVTMSDALTLACAAWEHQGSFFPASETGLEAANVAAGLVGDALQHLIVVLATSASPVTECEVRTIRLCRRAVAGRDPRPGATAADWQNARRAYEAARAAELAADDGDADDRLGDARYAAEDVLMAIPSPDASAFAFKYLVAHGGRRETDCWNEMLDTEAKRFTEVEG